MEIQNINLDFNSSVFSSLYGEKIYILEETNIINEFKLLIQSNLVDDVSNIVIQLTYDQTLSEPRILINNMKNPLMILSINDLEINFPNIYDKFLMLKVDVINQIENQRI